MRNGCEFYNPINTKDIVNCCNCKDWNSDRCKQEDRLLDNRTSIVHAYVPIVARRMVLR